MTDHFPPGRDSADRAPQRLPALSVCDRVSHGLTFVDRLTLDVFILDGLDVFKADREPA